MQKRRYYAEHTKQVVKVLRLLASTEQTCKYNNRLTAITTGCPLQTQITIPYYGHTN